MIYSLSNVSYQYIYDNNVVVDNLSLNIDNGITTILMDVQSGKSTLVKLLLGLVKPTSGTVLYNDQPMSEDFSSRSVALVSDSPVLLRGSVLRNVRYPLLVRKINRKQATALTNKHLADNKLSHLANIKVSRLQYFSKIIVTMLRATIVSRQLYIFDGVADKLTGDEWQQLLQLLPSGSSMINICSNQARAIGRTIAVSGNEVIYDGNNMPSQVLDSVVWLYGKGKEN